IRDRDDRVALTDAHLPAVEEVGLLRERAREAAEGGAVVLEELRPWRVAVERERRLVDQRQLVLRVRGVLDERERRVGAVVDDAAEAALQRRYLRVVAHRCVQGLLVEV